MESSLPQRLYIPRTSHTAVITLRVHNFPKRGRGCLQAKAELKPPPNISNRFYTQQPNISNTLRVFGLTSKNKQHPSISNTSKKFCRPNISNRLIIFLGGGFLSHPTRDVQLTLPLPKIIRTTSLPTGAEGWRPSPNART